MKPSERIYKQYVACGLLARGIDGQSSLSLKDLKTAIGKITLDKGDTTKSDKVLNLGETLINNGPTYSATLLGNYKFNVMWYYYKFSDPFHNDQLPNLGNRTTLVAILKNSRVFVSGLCLWDADSNNRNSGLVPNNQSYNKVTPQNDFAFRMVFDGIGNFEYEKPKSLNNLSWYNPMIRPFTENSIAKTLEEISSLLLEAGDLKEFWVSHLKKEAKGFNSKWAKYITYTYGSGVETEVLLSPVYDHPVYGNLKFSIDDIEAMAFVTDGVTHGAKPMEDYEKAVVEFFEDGTGWLNPPSMEQIDRLPIVSITRVALPNVQIDSTTTTNLGEAWKEYLTQGDVYQDPLTSVDFKTIKDGIDL